MNPWVKLALVMTLLVVASGFSIAVLLRLYRKRDEVDGSDEVVSARSEVPDPVKPRLAMDTDPADEHPEDRAAQPEAVEETPEPDAMASRLSRLRQRGQQEEGVAPITLSQPLESEDGDAADFIETPPESTPLDARSRLKARLRGTARKAIRFRRDFPFGAAGRATSFFGGIPFAPADFEWPRSETTRLPLTFMGQLDCRELPRAALPPAAPDQGILYFFSDLVKQSGQEDPGFVLHIETAGAPLYDHPVPDFAPRCYGQGAPEQFPWIARTKRSEDHYPRAFPKIVMKPALADSWSATAAFAWPEDAPVSFDELRAELMEEVERQIYGQELQPEAEQDSPEILRLPFETFPHNWRGIELAAGQMLGLLDPYRAEDNAIVDHLRDANDWVERARAQKINKPLDDGDAEAFRSWLEQVATRDDLLKRSTQAPSAAAQINATLRAISPVLIEECVRDPSGAAADIPQEAIAALRWRHLNATAHQMFGSGCVAGGDAAPYVDRHILLLQIAADAVLQWQFGEGAVWQYWISPSDLAARKFDRTILLLATA